MMRQQVSIVYDWLKKANLNAGFPDEHVVVKGQALMGQYHINDFTDKKRFPTEIYSVEIFLGNAHLVLYPGGSFESRGFSQEDSKRIDDFLTAKK